MKCSRLLIQCKVTDITNKPTDNSYKLNQDISPVTLCDFFPGQQFILTSVVNI